MHGSSFWEISQAREGEFVRSGLRPRYFFAHKLYHLPKCAPDGYGQGLRMCGRWQTEQHWEILLYADAAQIADLPRKLMFDDELLWHRQHFGKPGQIAWAAVLLDANELVCVAQQSDLVQRIGRAPEYKSRVENRFRGWPRMLLNGILALAAHRGISCVRTPTSDLAMRYTDPRREVGRTLFERVYDHPVARYGAREEGGFWVIDVSANLDLMVMPKRVTESFQKQRTVCICHDLERGLGHVGVDETLRVQADASASSTLERMLELEDAAGVRTTYNVVGSILPEVQDTLGTRGHCVAFHSFDHSPPTDAQPNDQLKRCRQVDYRIKGYRPPRSLITRETSDRALAFHNFEWLASSQNSLGVDEPKLSGRLVRLPIALDDYPLYRGFVTYALWERLLLKLVGERSFTAVSLHDCYARWWLHRYPALLERLADRARLCTMDEVSAEVVLSNGA
ncbi:MAG TPA: hypothetical protein VGL51_10590 [Solirubrobacteraceae bacterium]